MRLIARLLLFVTALPLAAQTPSKPADALQAVYFLQGTWEAKTGVGAAAKVIGTYVFQKELKGHILVRHATTSGCTGPDTFDCEHGDLLYLFQDPGSQALKAIYFDNEGHVIHYGVSTPDASTAVFLSEEAPGPRFRLTYHLEGPEMSGKFQMQIPGQEKWTSYLEWSGAKR